MAGPYHPKQVVHTPDRKGRDAGAFGRRGGGEDRVASRVIPETRGVREPGQNFPAGGSVDRNKGPREP